MPLGPVVASVASLPDRFIPARAAGVHARFQLRIGSLARDVVVTPDGCRVEPARGKPEVVISTSPATWAEIDGGRISGIEAFAQRRLTIRGSIQRALLFEPLFERADAGAMRYHVEHVRVGGLKISTLFAGDPGAEPLVMLHGLGATKASLLTVVPEIAKGSRVIVPDLPGFGASSKPRGRYDAAWFARIMFGFLDELGIDRVRLVGNSMGGRIAQEMALTDPDRIEAIACLAPATAFSRRPAVALVRLLRPELGIAAGFIPRSRVTMGLKSLFSKPNRIEEAWYEAAADDFLKTWRSPRARMAFFAALRHIYLEEPYGETGFFTRLARLRSRALYIYGRGDVLITSHFAKKIGSVLPAARVELWDDCGHAPQLEHPDKTARTLIDFFSGSRLLYGSTPRGRAV